MRVGWALEPSARQMLDGRNGYRFYKAHPLCQTRPLNQKPRHFEHLRGRHRCYRGRSLRRHHLEQRPTSPVSLTALACQLGQMQAITLLKPLQGHDYHNPPLLLDSLHQNLEMFTAQREIMRRKKSRLYLRYRKHTNLQKTRRPKHHSSNANRVCLLMLAV